MMKRKWHNRAPPMIGNVIISYCTPAHCTLLLLRYKVKCLSSRMMRLAGFQTLLYVRMYVRITWYGTIWSIFPILHVDKYNSSCTAKLWWFPCSPPNVTPYTKIIMIMLMYTGSGFSCAWFDCSSIATYRHLCLKNCTKPMQSMFYLIYSGVGCDEEA